jgi:PHD/YefM family antitoxin component YafN of YafNO toxin-antitoxin module
MMKTIEISTASQPLSTYANEFREETIVLTLNGEAVAIVVCLKDSDPESLSLSTNPKFLEIIEKAREEFRTGKTLSLEEMKRAVLD